MKKLTDGAFQLALGNANAVLLQSGTELALVDAGFPNKAQVVLDAVRRLGRTPQDLRNIVFTHGHPDHIGSAAALVRATGATTWMHAADAPLAETGGPFRPMVQAPGLLQRLLFRLVWHPDERMEPFRIDHRFADGDVLPVAGGLRTVGTPGHCAGQVAFLSGRLLIAGDVGMHILGVGDPLGFEDTALGRQSQRRVAGLAFEVASFGHGRPILSGASARIRKAWG